MRTNRGINSRVQNRIFFSETKTNENKKCFLRCNGRINSTLEHSSIRTRKILMIQNFFSSSSKSRMIRIKAENFLAIRDKLNIWKGENGDKVSPKETMSGKNKAVSEINSTLAWIKSTKTKWQSSCFKFLLTFKWWIRLEY